MQLTNIKEILGMDDVIIPTNIENNILFELKNIKKNKYSVHIGFLIDNRSKNIISYGFNFYFKTKSFPFSIHA